MGKPTKTDRERLNAVKHPTKREEFSELPVWVRNVAAMHYMLGTPFADGCKKFGKSEHSLRNYKTSPAWKEWVAEMEEKASDPTHVASSTIRASMLNVTLEYLAAYEKAIASGDYKEVAKISQDLLDRGGITKKKEVSDARVVVKLDLGGTSLEAPVIEATYEEVVQDEAYYESVYEDE